ncbi:MAG: hypothetical protein V4506_18500 [Bacteroidota bacterium]
MDAEDIIHLVQESERRKHIVRFDATRNARRHRSEDEHWQIKLVNDPNMYEASLNINSDDEEPAFYKFKISSIQQGQKIAKDIFDFHELRRTEIVSPGYLDAEKQLYLIVQVLYSSNSGQTINKPVNS